MGLLSGLQGGASTVRKRVSGGSDQDRAPEGSDPDDTSILCVNIHLCVNLTASLTSFA